MKLLIISHTDHYYDERGNIVGWGPTIREIDEVSVNFEKVYHIAVLQPTIAPKSALPYHASNVELVPLSPSGGKSVVAKIKVLTAMFSTLRTVRHYLKKVDVFQLRTPTGIGVYLIPYLSFFSSKPGWYKYAGNWIQRDKPLGYAIQKWWLKQQSRKVTVNGHWPSEPSHILSFENPCLTEDEWTHAKEIIAEKEMGNTMDYCFVGGMHKAKGIEKLLKAWITVSSPKKGKLHLVGGGGIYQELFNEYQTYKDINFHGPLEKSAVYEIYKSCAFLVLPSENEGFPKVVGEGMNYGCVPIVSDVSCIGQYVRTGENGFLLKENTVEEIVLQIEASSELSNELYRNYVVKNHEFAKRFTYEHYTRRIHSELIN